MPVLKESNVLFYYFFTQKNAPLKISVGHLFFMLEIKLSFCK